MAVVFKRLNSEETKFATWTNEDEQSNSLPITMQDGSPIPINNFGINVQSLKIFYWNGTEWKPCRE